MNVTTFHRLAPGLLEHDKWKWNNHSINDKWREGKATTVKSRRATIYVFILSAYKQWINSCIFSELIFGNSRGENGPRVTFWCHFFHRASNWTKPSAVKKSPMETPTITGKILTFSRSGFSDASISRDVAEAQWQRLLFCIHSSEKQTWFLGRDFPGVTSHGPTARALQTVGRKTPADRFYLAGKPVMEARVQSGCADSAPKSLTSPLGTPVGLRLRSLFHKPLKIMWPFDVPDG